MLSRNIKKGQIARSIAGRDHGAFYVVVGLEDDSVLVVNGNNRSMTRPKRKNIKHLWFTNHYVSQLKDEKIISSLAHYVSKDV